MELTPRLRSVAEQVPSGAVLADIGTDHAYLPVRLILERRIDRAIAADLREGPLERAKETAKRYGVSDRISFRLCNGLADIGSQETDAIAIAGMGGETISAILSEAPWTKQGKLLLLQPMTSFTDLRLWLQQNGYRIEKETISREGQRLYTCLTVKGGDMEPLTPAELWAGKQSSDPLRGDFLDHMAAKAQRALAGQKNAASPDGKEIDFLTRVLDGIAQMKKELSV
ncbi:MAG: class I SAM-dependent methyltransferase [Oscillospiraceae bacterium]|nr:class I SAM-dependent methyltransferase [Oscillospiraceae bacterium]